MTLIMSSCGSTQKKITEENGNKPLKTTDFEAKITNKYWKLITLEGQEVHMVKTRNVRIT